jgi:hypothetical protein
MKRTANRAKSHQEVLAWARNPLASNADFPASAIEKLGHHSSPRVRRAHRTSYFVTCAEHTSLDQRQGFAQEYAAVDGEIECLKNRNETMKMQNCEVER